MAVFKRTHASGCETNPFFLELFRDHSESDERERLWHTAMAHAGEGTPPLRFPIYECLYLINFYSQKLVDLLDEAGNRFDVKHETLVYDQSLIDETRQRVCMRAGTRSAGEDGNRGSCCACLFEVESEAGSRSCAAGWCRRFVRQGVQPRDHVGNFAKYQQKSHMVRKRRRAPIHIANSVPPSNAAWKI